MINGIEGIPGSGKSYEAVAFHLLPTLEAGRLVITNLPIVVEMFAAINPDYAKLIELRTRAQPVRGTWDFGRVDEHGNGEAFQLFPEGHDYGRRLEIRTKGEAFQLVSDGHAYPLPGTFGPFSGVWCYYSTWKHPKTGQGPLFVIDEAHVPLPRLTADSQVREWFSLHRHFNVDVLLMSQRFRKIHPDISELTAILVRCRKADILGRKNCYIRKVHSGYPGAVISVEERPYKEQYFPLYKSHTQGNSVVEAGTTDVKPLSVKLRRITIGWWVFSGLVCVYLFWPNSDENNKSSKVVQGLPQDASATLPAVPARAHPARPIDTNTAIEGDTPLEIDADPFAGKKIHLTGWMMLGQKSAYTFTISDGGRRIFDLQLSEIIATGYTFKAFGHCAGMLTFGGRQRPVTCDAPALAVGTQDRPVVVTEARSPVMTSFDQQRP